MSEDLLNISGAYRTNPDGTETLAWRIDEHGYVECIHAAPNVCARCFKGDQRLFRNNTGAVMARPDARSGPATITVSARALSLLSALLDVNDDDAELSSNSGASQEAIDELRLVVNATIWRR